MCRYRWPVDDSRIDHSKPQVITVGRQSCSLSMSWPRFRSSRSSRRKSWSTLPAKSRTSTSSPGEYVAHEGEGRSLAIVVEGKAELTKLVNGVEQVIGVRVPGELGGEVPMTLGTPLPASMRAVEPSRVLKLTVEVFHTLAAMAPQISAAVGAAAMERMEMLKKRHRTAARARDVRHWPAPRPGRPQLRQLPSPQPDSLRTPGSRRSRRRCTHRAEPRWPPLSGGGAPRRHSADRPDDAVRCHSRRTDGRARPRAVRRGDRRRWPGGTDGSGQRRLRGPARLR